MSSDETESPSAPDPELVGTPRGTPPLPSADSVPSPAFDTTATSHLPRRDSKLRLLKHGWSFGTPGRSFYQKLEDQYGRDFLRILASIHFGVKGVMYHYLKTVQLPYFRELKLDGVQYQTNMTISWTPWAMKGLFGALTDILPIGGYHGKWYMFISNIFGVIGLLGLATMSHDSAKRHVWAVGAFFFFSQIQCALQDMLTDGKYTEMMALRPDHGPEIVTYVWGLATCGVIIASASVGPISDNVGPDLVFWLCLPMSLQSVYPVLKGWLPEERIPPPHGSRIQVAKLRAEWKTFLMGAISGVAALGLAIVGAFSSPMVQLIYSAIVAIIVSVIAFALLSSAQAASKLYFFLSVALYVQIPGAIDFWYTAGPSCVPNGPNFDFTYYQTVSQLVGALASALALLIFQTVITKWRFRSAFWITTLVRIMVSCVDLIIIERVNLKIGLPDKAAFILGDAMLLNLTQMLDLMPAILLLSKLTSPLAATTSYAVLQSFMNFGMNASRAFGVWLIEAFAIQTGNEADSTCNFRNLTYLVLVAHIILPATAIPLVFILIPDMPIRSPDSATTQPDSATAVDPNWIDPIV
ncbi:unnamed protein product [Vitrella brassicaformis CCMP3155]|uniref:Uncharacterized protein n=2 Tax=Vitrella brassicaformis TaxID=1169539 RepID=A0A0G4G327_VITBC|nr:unnamed protein product [Vitrella brassicaformis CCMP3155]|eukprot:CEM22134.1 unnamed protein product [Vitrella brassicaformis CCMP3155]